ncbi:aminoglycoside adenylyltransferase family protein [Xenorhabdus anantnagensis]|uniref:Aminoglycoside (3'') (9) adenylyltransferase n=1 Tax=Xenorhabdus anantnagensis TaxID=3025875 RepID=A0ABT5LVI1_9GAMM|nr:aminoglycoside adenylyltransferase family protein [Xenorhabdus anantnagensis]MDC9598441.1 aminoglycoside adenylyltransferase family protein [Xenorhabdus anantnagensis]
MSCLVTIPSEADKALLIVQKRLAESLIAVYLHGSAVVGGLRPLSDVDLLVVIDQPMTSEVRESLAADLMMISGRYPFDPDGRRPVELIVFLRADLTASLYPAQSEFIYGEWLRHEYEMGEIPKPVCDPELTLVLAQSRQEAIPLVGSNAISLLPAIPRSDIRRAIKDALPNLIETLQGDERNVLLTLARMWRTLVTGEFVSKDVAADWAAARLPAIQAAVLANVRETYLRGGEEDWQNRQQELQITVNSLRNYVLTNL